MNWKTTMKWKPSIQAMTDCSYSCSICYCCCFWRRRARQCCASCRTPTTNGIPSDCQVWSPDDPCSVWVPPHKPRSTRATCWCVDCTASRSSRSKSPKRHLRLQNPIQVHPKPTFASICPKCCRRVSLSECCNAKRPEWIASFASQSNWWPPAASPWSTTELSIAIALAILFKFKQT